MSQNHSYHFNAAKHDLCSLLQLHEGISSRNEGSGFIFYPFSLLCLLPFYTGLTLLELLANCLIEDIGPSYSSMSKRFLVVFLCNS